MSVLVDTNILLRSAEPTHAQHQAAYAAVGALIGRGEALCVVPQVLIEIWAVATRPCAHNGLGFLTAETSALLTKILNMFPLREEVPGVYAHWRALVEQHDVSGKAAHDAHLVAAMSVHNIASILTFNKQDFLRYQQVAVITPDEVLASSRP